MQSSTATTPTQCSSLRRLFVLSQHLPHDQGQGQPLLFHPQTTSSSSSAGSPQNMPSSAWQHLKLEMMDASVALVTLQRPKALNALCQQLVEELLAVLRALDAEPNVRAIVLTGSNKAFAAGADIKEMADKTVAQMNQPGHFTSLLAEVAATRKPIIAAVNGYALGGGCELAMACDIIVAGSGARFGQPEIKLGTIPGIGGTQRLTRAIGKAKAMDMVLTGQFLTAEEAERAGLVSKVVPDEQTVSVAIEKAKLIAAQSKPIVAMAKEAVNRAEETSLSEGLLFERRLFYSTFGTEDQKEGMAAFVDKRKPHWKDK
ncbi:putative enoyl-CoA hydratase, mitochondrial [Balamuthia mandrillaris]